MANQSSANVAWRALVMLVCLVAIPLAAVLGASLPDLVNRLLEFKKDFTSARAEDSSEAPPFDSAAHDEPWGNMPAPAASANPGSGEGQLRAAPQAPNGRVAPPSWSPAKRQALAEWAGGRDGFAGGPGTAVAPAGGPIREADATAASFNAPIGTAPGATPSRPRPFEAGPASLVPVGPRSSGQKSPQARGPSAASSTPRYPASNPQQPTATDQFTYIQRRLRQLGATYYLLEPWGPQWEHRFHVRMAVGGSTNYVRRFEAIDPDPVGAMAKVLEQVEAWRAGL